MKRVVERQMSVPELDSLVGNYIDSFKKEFLDDELLHDGRWDVFAALSSVRKCEFAFYPFKQFSSCAVFGDRHGALALALLDKCAEVVSYLPSDFLRRAVGARFSNRKNFFARDFFEAGQGSAGLKGQFDYAAVNLEGACDWSVQMPAEFNNLVAPAIESLKADGSLLISVPAYKFRELKELLSALGGFKLQIHDPFGIGLYVVEATSGGRLAEEKDLDWSAYKTGGYVRSPLLNEKWIRKYDFPIWSGQIKDQDYSKIQEVKAVQIGLLKKLSLVCQANGLTLYPMYGTLLGLMRGGRFIDGDDDIDVALMREDYDKLLSLKDAFCGDYFLQSPQSDNCFFGGYARLRNSKTTAIHPQNWWVDCNEGIFIDIFPIDKASSKPAAEKRKLKKIRFFQRLLYAYSYGYFRDFSDMKLLKWKFHKYFGKLTKRGNVIGAFDALLKSGDSKTKLSIYPHYRNGSLGGNFYYDAKDFKNTFTMDFEGVPLNVPCGWANILAQKYGGGFLNVPGFNEWKFRHGFYDPALPYGVWKKRFGGLKNPASIKEDVILFGDGEVFAACLSFYKSRVKIPCLVLLPGEKKEADAVKGIPVLSFDEFAALKRPRDSYRGIICSGDALLADELLAKNGLDNLYIFWHDRNWMLMANQSAVWKYVKNLGGQE